MLVLIGLIHSLLFAILAGNLVYLRRTQRSSLEVPLPSLSVLIPARNEADNLRRLLPALLEQRYDHFEIIVYDDGSDDDTPDVLNGIQDPRLHSYRGGQVPEGWIGKVHALYVASRRARGEVYLFLDADAVLPDSEALARLVGRFARLPAPAVATGLTQLRGRGLLLVSLVPNAVLTTLPWPLTGIGRRPILGALNGQCWMIRGDDYHGHEPHRRFPSEILEDVRIGQYLAGVGVRPWLVDARDAVQVLMYTSFGAAWRGFRKNAYLLMGGRPWTFAAFFLLFLLTFVVGPIATPAFLVLLYLLKGITDRVARMPAWVTVLAPVSFVLAVALQLDSAVHHWLGRVEWKGRRLHTRRKS